MAERQEITCVRTYAHGPMRETERERDAHVYELGPLPVRPHPGAARHVARREQLLPGAEGDLKSNESVTHNRIPFGDHPLKLERYGED